MSRKTAFNGSAAGRRRAQRSHLQNPQTLSSDLIHRPTPSRAQIQAKGKHHTPERIEDALPIKFVAQDIFGSARNINGKLSERPSFISKNLHTSMRSQNLALPEGNLCAWFAKKKENNGEVTP